MPTNQQLGAISLKGYRELLRKLKAQSNSEDSSALFQTARERVLLNLQQRQSLRREKLDLKGALARAKQRVFQAKSDLITLKRQKKAVLKEAYQAVKAQGLPAAHQVIFGSKSSSQTGSEVGSSSRGSSSSQLTETSVKDLSTVLGKDGLVRTAVIGMVAAASKLVMQGLSTTTIEGRDILEAALDRPPGQALITVSNHVAALDDPLVVSALLPARQLLHSKNVRWTLCATDRCFKHDLLVPFFRAGKVLPVDRGAGLQQAGMAAARARLAAGDWVHIFPEGTRSRDGSLGPVRKGVGHLIAACQRSPLVVPFVHAGMDQLMPRGSALPRAGQHVHILVGEPLDVNDLLTAARQQGWDERRLHTALADRVGQALAGLKARLEGLSPEEQARVEVVDAGALMPLIEEEIDSLLHVWGNNVRQNLGLACLSSKMEQARWQASSEPGRTAHADSCWGVDSLEDLIREDAAPPVAFSAALPAALAEPLDGGRRSSNMQGKAQASARCDGAGGAGSGGLREQALLPSSLQLLRGSLGACNAGEGVPSGSAGEGRTGRLNATLGSGRVQKDAVGGQVSADWRQAVAYSQQRADTMARMLQRQGGLAFA